MNCWRKDTSLVQIGNRKEEHFHAVATPIYFSTAFRHEEIGTNKGYDYTRTGNPTRDVLEKAVATLESGDQGFATSSGMAAIQLVFSLFEKGSHFIASRDIYGGNYRLFELFTKKYDFQFSYWDGKEYEELHELVRSNTKAVFIESPTNPLLKTVDLAKISQFTKEKGILHIVDNTLFTPLLQRPIEEGADLVIHSATKYLAGHNDLLAGLVIAKGAALSEELSMLHNAIGAVLAPFDCYNLIRGLKTLALRMEKHEANAKHVLAYLNEQPLVKRTFYPGKSGMVSFEITNEELVSPFLKSLKLFTFAESLGGVESFITYPATQTHMDIPEKVRHSYGLTNGLLRLSVGVEHEEDLIQDLEQAFQTVAKIGGRESEFSREIKN